MKNFFNKYFYKSAFIFSVAAVVLLSVPKDLTFAQENRSYKIDLFNVSMVVNKDSTVDVVEEITYNFTGEYHQGWRSVSHKDIGAITDVYVVDKKTGEWLSYSGRTLEKTDPSSWGKYTYSKEDGHTNIQWYYDAYDQVRTWEIHYKVHGMIGFYESYDEVYWNLFTEYEVPIENVFAKIVLPDGTSLLNSQSALYRTFPGQNQGQFSSGINENEYFFSTRDVLPYEAVTIALSFPKGITTPAEFWKDLARLNFGLIIGILIILITAICLFIYWIRNEYLPRHDKSIVPQYEPPNDLKPAEMDIIYNEGLSKKSWPASIIDLAVRGYVKIEEAEKEGFVMRVLTFILLILPVAVVTFILMSSIRSDEADPVGLVVFIFIFVVIVLSVGTKILRKLSGVQDYKIEIIKENYFIDDKLDDYEKSFLSALFKTRKVFSTKSMRESQYAARALYMSMKKIEENILDEIVADRPGVYSKSIAISKKRGWVIAIIFGVLFISFVTPISNVVMKTPQFMFMSLGLVVSAILYLWYFKFNPKLSIKGNDLWRQIEGFRWYLKTAEKYRMQNLTPELFEKFLPYAIIFGVEKQWSKNFESLITAPPNWYAGSAHASGLNAASGFSSGAVAGSMSGFSASSFSKSFSTSFSSAFASSGGSGSSGGGSGGGGGAGGGGGGGGGGAS